MSEIKESIFCGFVLPPAQQLKTPVLHSPLEIQSQFLILKCMTKRPEHILVMHKTLVTNLATNCGDILSEIRI